MCRGLRHERRGRDNGRILQYSQWRRSAISCQSGVEHRQVSQRDANATECQRQGRRPMIMRKLETGARKAQCCRQSTWSHFVQKLHCRCVVGLLQCFTRADSAMKSAVKIGRRVVTEPYRPVLNKCVGRQHAQIERKTIDEGLQRRSGRAHGAYHIDHTSRTKIVAPANIGENRAVTVIDNQQRYVGVITKKACLPGHHAFDTNLKCRIERRPGADGVAFLSKRISKMMRVSCRSLSHNLWKI